jgi:hypothetical protein
MSRWLTWRRVGLLLQTASLAGVGAAIAALSGVVFGRGGSEDPHGYGLFFGSIYLAALVAIALIGVLGLARWWRTGRDTPLIAYDVFVLLLAAQFVPPALDEINEAPVVGLDVLTPWVILAAFLVLTIAAALAVYNSRPAATEPSGSL